MAPKVSVMIPAYNAEPFIYDCVMSVLDQNYSNVEVVVVDDHSMDNTYSILEDIKQQYPDKVFVYRNEQNIGVTLNCNKALGLCSGKYICFFAGDDIMLPNKISTQVQILENDSEASICYHPVDTFDSLSGKTIFVTEGTGRTIYSCFDIIEKAGLPGANSVMARSDCIPSEKYNLNFPQVSDWLFFIELSLRGKILFTDKVFTRYRKHTGGVSSKADSLLDETLNTLDYVTRRFGGNNKIVSSCRIARRRYLLGSLFRTLKTSNADLLVELIGRFYRNRDFFIAFSIMLYRYTFFNVTIVNKSLCFFIQKVIRG